MTPPPKRRKEAQKISKILCTALITLLVLSCSATAYAQEVDPEHFGSISLSLGSPESPIAGAKFNIYFVASATAQSDGTMIYAYTEFFKNCSIALDDPDLAEKLSDYVEKTPVPTEELITDENGRTTCEDLPHGLYLLRQTGSVEGYTDCSPFLVSLPHITESQVIYDVNASPKTDIVRLIPITINIIWNTPASVIIPSEMPVELLCGGNVVESAILNPGNSWQVHYPENPDRDDYNVRRLTLPKGFTATYTRNGKDYPPAEQNTAASGGSSRALAYSLSSLTRQTDADKGYVFIITITSTLAQTGQLIWPIPLLAAAGLLLLTLGFVMLRKNGKNNA